MLVDELDPFPPVVFSMIFDCSSPSSPFMSCWPCVHCLRLMRIKPFFCSAQLAWFTFGGMQQLASTSAVPVLTPTLLLDTCMHAAPPRLCVKSAFLVA